MHAFTKWKAQVEVGDSFLGSVTVHKQPKEHLFTECAAKVVEVNEDNIKCSLEYKHNYSNLPLEITLKKANVMEYDSNFRIIYNESDILILFVVSKLYLVN